MPFDKSIQHLKFFTMMMIDEVPKNRLSSGQLQQSAFCHAIWAAYDQINDVIFLTDVEF